MVRKVEVAIIGAGTAGLNAASQVARHTKDFVLIDGGILGTTCARVGCMPSKVLIQVAEDFHRRQALAGEGLLGASGLHVEGAAALAHVRRLRDGFYGKIATRVESNMASKLVRETCHFISPRQLELASGEVIEAERYVLAVGSRPIVPAAWRELGDRVITTDEVFELEELPKSLGVIGLGAIGVEIGQAMARLGVEVTGFDLLDTVAGLSDPAVSERAIALIGAEFPLVLGAPAELAAAADGRVKVTGGGREVVVERVLVSMGRRHNLDRLNLEALGVPLDARGVPVINPLTGQLADLPIYVAGDATADRAILHEATHTGRVAGHNAGRGTATAFKRKPAFAIAFTDPQICQVGASWSDLAGRDDVVVGERDFADQARAKVQGRDRGLLRVYGRKSDGQILGACMVAPAAEHLGHLLSWALASEPTVYDLLAQPFYHPVVEEGLENALADLASKVDAKPTAPPGLLLA
jgi:dihydrolipoamide dehydrogenase